MAAVRQSSALNDLGDAYEKSSDELKNALAFVCTRRRWRSSRGTRRRWSAAPTSSSASVAWAWWRRRCRRIRRHVSGGADRSMARPTRPTTSGRRRERRKRTIGKEREQSDPNLPPGPRRLAARFNERRSIAGCTPTYQRRSAITQAAGSPGGPQRSSTRLHSTERPRPRRASLATQPPGAPRVAPPSPSPSRSTSLSLYPPSPLYGRSSPRTATGKRRRPGPPRPRARAPGC